MECTVRKLLAFVVVLFIAGCSAGAPNGSDAKVTDSVLEISKQELKKQLVPMIYAQVTGIPVGLLGMEITYEMLKENINEGKNYEVVDVIDKSMEKTVLSLKNIRTNKIEKDIKKSTSSADLLVNDKIVKIEYTAQRTGSGDVYVEVQGLK